MPGSYTRQEIFEDLVLEAADRLTAEHGTLVERIGFDVALVPDDTSMAEASSSDGVLPLGAVRSSEDKRAPHIVVFRRPVETVAGSREALPWLVFDVVVELVAELLMMPPEQVHPDYRGKPSDEGE